MAALLPRFWWHGFLKVAAGQLGIKHWLSGNPAPADWEREAGYLGK
jgi:hypothetical protein